MPTLVKNVVRCSQCSAALPISSASSRLAVSSGSSPSSSSLPAGISSMSGSSAASRGWRTSHTWLVVDRDDAPRPRVADDLAGRLLAVREAELALLDGEDLALVDRLAVQLLEVALAQGRGIMPASVIPAAAAARKNSGSSRPMLRVGHR